VLAAILGGLGLLLAPLIGDRTLTLTLARLGVGAALLGVLVRWWLRRPQDRLWPILGGGVSAAVLLLTLAAPGLLTSWWEIDRPFPLNDPNPMTRVPRDNQSAPPEPLGSDEWVDGIKEAIRQDDLLITAFATRVGPLWDRGHESYLQVHLRFANVGFVRVVTFEGFSNDRHRPVLTDDSGHSYRLLEQRTRKRHASGLVFEQTPPRDLELLAPRYLDYLLVFEPPAAGFRPLKLEVPASAWGRRGSCKLTISHLFEPSLK
jgi:hypothetical protein